jgi:hypothetical protein
MLASKKLQKAKNKFETRLTGEAGNAQKSISKYQKLV